MKPNKLQLPVAAPRRTVVSANCEAETKLLTQPSQLPPVTPLGEGPFLCLTGARNRTGLLGTEGDADFGDQPVLDSET